MLPSNLTMAKVIVVSMFALGFLAALAGLILWSLDDTPTPEAHLHRLGYTQITLTPAECRTGAGSGFTARTSMGGVVTGVVCCEAERCWVEEKP